MTTVRITIMPATGEAVVAFQFDRDVLELVKTVPVWARKWNPMLREWRVFESFVPELTGSLQAAGHRVGHQRRSTERATTALSAQRRQLGRPVV